MDKARDLAAGPGSELQQFRGYPDWVINQCMLLSEAKWDISRRSLDKEEKWLRGIFYPVLDQTLSSLTHRFKQIKDTFSCMSFFLPRLFELIRNDFEDTEKLVLERAAISPVPPN